MDVVHLNQKQLAARWCISEATLERWRSEGIERTWRSAMGKLVDGDDGLPAEEVGSWAKEKHDYLCRYIDISRSTRAKWDVAPTSIQLALARGHRWLAMLESGEAKSLKEIATREGIDNSYVSRMVNLAKLAPDIVAAILDDALPNHITLFDLAVDPPALWDERRARLV